MKKILNIATLALMMNCNLVDCETAKADIATQTEILTEKIKAEAVTQEICDSYVATREAYYDSGCYVDEEGYVGGTLTATQIDAAVATHRTTCEAYITTD